MEEKANMTKEERIAEAGNIAGEYFKQGLNCSECVLQSFLDTQNLDLEAVWDKPEILVEQLQEQY